QVLLRHDPWLAVDSGGLHQVVVGLLPSAFTHDRRHIWVIHLLRLKANHHNGRHAGQLRRLETRASTPSWNHTARAPMRMASSACLPASRTRRNTSTQSTGNGTSSRDL